MEVPFASSVLSAAARVQSAGSPARVTDRLTINASTGVPTMQPASGHGEKDKLQAMEVAQDFEAIFLRMLIKGMHAATLKGGLFGDNLASEIYQDMFFEEAASLMSKQKPGLGLADIVYHDILKHGSGTVTAPGKDVMAILDILGSVPSIASSKTSR